MSEQVECYSSQSYAERPLAFTWQGERLMVSRVLESRQIPEGKYFRVSAGDKGYFELIYHQDHDTWSINQV